jgi:hypothetical protein
MRVTNRLRPRDRAHPGDTDVGRAIAVVRSGVLAGLVSVVAFTAIHQVLISDIWFSLVPMLVAGALCGALVAWTWVLLVATPSVGSWIRYNLAYLLLFGLLAVASIAVFEPIATADELATMGASRGEVIARSMPLNVGFALVAAVLVTWLFGGGWRQLGPVLAAVAVLTLFLGHNVSIIGLVEFGADELSLVGMLLGLIVAINAVFAAVFLALQWRLLAARRSYGPGQPVPGLDRP